MSITAKPQPHSPFEAPRTSSTRRTRLSSPEAHYVQSGKIGENEADPGLAGAITPNADPTIMA